MEICSCFFKIKESGSGILFKSSLDLDPHWVKAGSGSAYVCNITDLNKAAVNPATTPGACDAAPVSGGGRLPARPLHAPAPQVSRFLQAPGFH
jgi:hypothetical protein